MASSDQLKALIKSHANRDDEQFYSIAMQVAAHEAKLGHGKLAIELRDMIDSGKTRLVQEPGGKLLPISKPRGELANLLTVSYPPNRLAEMVLDEQAATQLARVLQEQRLLARIKEHGLSSRRNYYWLARPARAKP